MRKLVFRAAVLLIAACTGRQCTACESCEPTLYDEITLNEVPTDTTNEAVESIFLYFSPGHHTVSNDEVRLDNITPKGNGPESYLVGMQYSYLGGTCFESVPIPGTDRTFELPEPLCQYELESVIRVVPKSDGRYVSGRTVGGKVIRDLNFTVEQQITGVVYDPLPCEGDAGEPILEIPLPPVGLGCVYSFSGNATMPARHSWNWVRRYREQTRMIGQALEIGVSPNDEGFIVNELPAPVGECVPVRLTELSHNVIGDLAFASTGGVSEEAGAWLRTNFLPTIQTLGRTVAQEVLTNFSRTGPVAVSTDQRPPAGAVLLDSFSGAHSGFLTWLENQDTHIRFGVHDGGADVMPPQPLLDCHPISQAATPGFPRSFHSGMAPSGEGNIHFRFERGNQVQSTPDSLALRGAPPFNVLGDPLWFVQMSRVRPRDSDKFFVIHNLHESVAVQFCPLGPDGKSCPRPAIGESCGFGLDGVEDAFTCRWRTNAPDPADPSTWEYTYERQPIVFSPYSKENMHPYPDIGWAETNGDGYLNQSELPVMFVPNFRYDMTPYLVPGSYGVKFWLSHERDAEQDFHKANDFDRSTARQMGHASTYYYDVESERCAVEESASIAGDTAIVTEARAFRDETLMKHRLGFLAARKYYHVQEDIKKAVVQNPALAGKFIEIARVALEVAAAFENASPTDYSRPVIDRRSGEKIKAFIDELIVANAGKGLRDTLEAFRIGLIMVALPNAQNPSGGNYLTFGDVIRLKSGQLEWKSATSRNDQWLNYLKHYHRKLNPAFSSRIDSLESLVTQNFEGMVAVFIQFPELFIQFIESAGVDAGDEQISLALAAIAEASQDPAVMDNIRNFLESNDLDDYIDVGDWVELP